MYHEKYSLEEHATWWAILYLIQISQDPKDADNTIWDIAPREWERILEYMR